MQKAQFQAGDTILTEREDGRTAFLIVCGKVEVVVGSGAKAKAVATLRAGDVFGEMSLLTGEPRAASVVALGEVELLEIARPTFGRVLASHPELAANLANLLGQRRSQLRAVAQAGVASAEGAGTPEAKRIFGRLKEIFGLKEA